MLQTTDTNAGGERNSGWKQSGTDALVAWCTVAAVSFLEILFCQRNGTPIEIRPLFGATIALASVCALLSGAAGSALRYRRLALSLVLAAGLWPFTQHAASFVAWHLFHEEAWGIAGLVLAPLTAEGLLRAASRPAGRRILFVGAPVLLCMALWQHHVLVARSPTARTGSHPDVIVLVMDTTRRDRFGLYGYARPTTPNIDALAKSSEVFDSAWSTAPWTPPSHASLFTGELPAEHGVDGQACPPFHTQAKALAEVLRDQGYRTGAAVANTLLTTPNWGWERGFDEYLTYWNRSDHTLAFWLNRIRHGSDERWDPEERRAPNTLRLAKEWWANSADAPRFLFVNVIDAHFPYRPTEEFYRRFLPGVDPARAYAVEQAAEPHHLHRGVSLEEREILAGLYDAEIAYMDQEIGKFLDWLRERGDLDRTLLVLTSDHGERLGERGLTGHEVMMDPYLLRIPLIVRYPPRIEPRRVDSLVQIDGIPGYVLDLVGIEAPETMRARAIGRMQHELVVAQNQEPLGFLEELVKRAPGFDITPYRGDWTFVSDGKYGLVTSTHRAAAPCGLFDLAADPELTHDLSAALPEIRSRFEAFESTLPSFRPVKASVLGPEVQKRLRSLGYAGGR